MPRRMTRDQQEILREINLGTPEARIREGMVPFPDEMLTVLSHHDCMDGSVVRCHRTVKTDTPSGAQTQGFRIHPDGTFERFI